MRILGGLRRKKVIKEYLKSLVYSEDLKKLRLTLFKIFIFDGSWKHDFFSTM